MFLTLVFIARQPLLVALAGAKLANTVSALSALSSYALQGHVRPATGILVAAGTVVGGFIGARQASVKAAKIVRPVLAVVTLLLLVKVVFDSVR
jgi:uncharacterized membrane protein YfcA